MDGISAVNKNLPASVYIPFVNSAWRNYCVLNIVESESKLFLTNTRAPFLVCIEVYRPEEILITSQNRFEHLFGNTASSKGEQSPLNRPMSASPHTQLPEMIIGTNSIRQTATPMPTQNASGLNQYDNSPNRVAYKANSNALQLIMPSNSNNAAVLHAMKKLHLNCDRQLSQGQIIKNFFPVDEQVNANEFSSMEGRRYYPKTMTGSMEFKGVSKQFLSQDNTTNEVDDQHKISNIVSDNDRSRDDPIFGVDDSDLKQSSDSSTVIERQLVKQKSHGIRKPKTPIFKALKYASGE